MAPSCRPHEGPRSENLFANGSAPTTDTLQWSLGPERAWIGSASPDLSRSGGADRAVVVHEVGGPGHEQAGRAKKQQQRQGDDGEVDTIHERPKAPGIVPIGWGGAPRATSLNCGPTGSVRVTDSGEGCALNCRGAATIARRRSPGARPTRSIGCAQSGRNFSKNPDYLFNVVCPRAGVGRLFLALGLRGTTSPSILLLISSMQRLARSRVLGAAGQRCDRGENVPTSKARPTLLTS